MITGRVAFGERAHQDKKLGVLGRSVTNTFQGIFKRTIGLVCDYDRCTAPQVASGQQVKAQVAEM